MAQQTNIIAGTQKIIVIPNSQKIQILIELSSCLTCEDILNSLTNNEFV